MADFEKKQPMLDRRHFVGGALATSALAALAGCGQKGGTTAGGSGSAATGGTTGGTLRYYINNPTSIDPYNLMEDQGTQVGFQLFDSLTQFDFENEEIKPLACDSWDVNDDATEFTFHLKEGTTFHNGDTVVAADWKRGWERILDPNTNPESPSGIGYHLAMVDGYDAFTKGEADELTGVTCPDDNTLLVKLAYSYADFPYVVSHPALAPVPAVALDDFQTFFRAPIGNGPFKMDGKWEDGQYINIVRYDDYYGDKAILDGVNFIIQKDQETAYREFQAGNLDVCDVPATQIPEARETYGESEDGYTATPGHQLLLGGEPSTYYLTINCSVAPWDNADFRRAVSMAINREAICDEVFHGTRTPADNIVPPGINGYEEGVWTYCKYDPDAAKELLAQIYPDGNIPTIKLTYNMDGGHKEVMDVVMASLKEVGITAEADTNEWTTILDRYDIGDYEIGRCGWVADYPIMDNFMYPLFFSTSGDNYSQIGDEAIDDALLDARATIDDAERIAKYQEVNATLGEQCWMIPLMFYTHTQVVGDNVAYYYLDPLKKADMTKVELVSA